MTALLEAFDRQAEKQAAEVIGEPPKSVFQELRNFLLREAENHDHQTKQHEIGGLLKLGQDQRLTKVFLGPSFDKNEPESLSRKPFLLGSGGSLSFGLVLRESEGVTHLESARFQFKSKADQILRYDVTPQARDLLREPRAHYHWSADLRLPAPILHPRHILEVIFRIVDPYLS